MSVALALINKPEIVFLDELTTGLDTAARRDVWKRLKELKNHGTTIFLTTHYMEEAESLCDRIFLIKDGKKVMRFAEISESLTSTECGTRMQRRNG